MSLLVARRGSINPRRASGGGGAFDPLSVAWHTAFWAEDPAWTDPGDGNAVSQWDDASGNGRHATQGTGSAQPTFRSSVAGLNSQPAVDFDGGDMLTSAGFTALTGPAEWFTVAKIDSLGSVRAIHDGDDTSHASTLFTNSSNQWAIYAGTSQTVAGADTDAHAFRVVFSGDTSNDLLVLDGTTIINANAGSQMPDAVRMGGNINGTTSLVGKIAFLGLKDGNLTAQERSDLLSWSQSHYGTP